MKNQLLPDREDYKVSYAFNKFFFGKGSDLDLSYDIPKDKWDRIKLTGWNLGSLLPHYHDFQPINKNKDIDNIIYAQKKATEKFDEIINDQNISDLNINKPWFLSGGISIKNIQEILNDINPFGVDLSSGVEKELGIKDNHIINNFIDKLKNA